MKITSPPKAYAPVGLCIYCGANPKSLSQEHIIAYGLGGNLKLPKASCRDCADITKRFEHTCLRTILGPLRIRLDMPTNHPQERPTALPVQLVLDSGRVETRTVPAIDYPRGMVLARFDPPGILTGSAPREDHPGELWYTVNNDDAAQLRQKYAVAGHRLGAFNAAPFVRMLAKIAHSFAVAD